MEAGDGGVTLNKIMFKFVFLASVLLVTAVLSCGLVWLVNDNGNKIMTVEMMNMTSDTNHNIIIQSLSCPALMSLKCINSSRFYRRFRLNFID